MYTTVAGNQVPNGATAFRPGRWAARRARVDLATGKAQADYAGLLCRNPRDFARFGLNVAKDVQTVNAATGCGPGTPSGVSGPPGAGGDAVAAAALASLGVASGLPAGSGVAALGSGNARSGGVRSRYAASGGASCDLNDGGVSVVPLNGPGGDGLPAVSAAPSSLDGPALMRGMGRYRPRKGMGACCSGFPHWGDAPASDGPGGAANSVGAWIAANPWLTAGLVAGLLLLSASGKGQRG